MATNIIRYQGIFMPCRKEQIMSQQQLLEMAKWIATEYESGAFDSSDTRERGL